MPLNWWNSPVEDVELSELATDIPPDGVLEINIGPASRAHNNSHRGSLPGYFENGGASAVAAFQQGDPADCGNDLCCRLFKYPGIFFVVYVTAMLFYGWAPPAYIFVAEYIIGPTLYVLLVAAQVFAVYGVLCMLFGVNGLGRDDSTARRCVDSVCFKLFVGILSFPLTYFLVQPGKPFNGIPPTG